ncbi:MAG: hypothetical protein JOY61_14170 [Chloroflexi bacterium]|nr:hypothetical protein [Chloroflexota bacterium]
MAGVLLLALLAGAVVSTTPTRADNAPMQPTTAGLVPGVPGTTVRMAAEKVDIHVVERDNAIHALVTASFDMFNRGPTVSVTTGFPKFIGTYMCPADSLDSMRRILPIFRRRVVIPFFSPHSRR